MDFFYYLRGMRTRTIAIAACILVTAACSRPCFNDTLKLTFDQPARIWEETLPLGNGRIGAMPDGGIWKEHIVLNEESLWSAANGIQPILKPFSGFPSYARSWPKATT